MENWPSGGIDSLVASVRRDKLTTGRVAGRRTGITCTDCGLTRLRGDDCPVCGPKEEPARAAP